MGNVMIEPACEPTYKWVVRRIIGRCREDVIHAVIKFVAVQGKNTCCRSCALFGNTRDTLNPMIRWTRTNAPTTSRGDLPSTAIGKMSM